MPLSSPYRPINTLSQLLCRLALCLLTCSLPAAAATATAQSDDFSLNLTDADISVFIQTVAEITGRNFVIDPRVKGKVTVITSTPTNADRIYEIFLATLQVNGYVAITAGDIVKIVPDAGSTQRAADSGLTSGGDELVTRVIEVRHVSAKQLALALRPLLPPTAYLSSHPEAKMLVIADTASNVERMARIVARIDGASDQGIDIVPLKHSDAAQVVDTLNALQQENMQKTQSPNGSIAALVADSRSNSILVSGPPDERANLRLLIARLDVPADNLRGAQVIFLKHAVAADLQKILKAIGEKLLKTKSKSPQQFEVEGDEATNALIVTAPADLMADLQSVIDRLDVRRAQVQVEGIIAEISSDRGAELGLEWQSALPGGDGIYAILRSPVSGGTTSVLPPGAGSSDGFPGSAGNGLSLGYFSGGDLRALLKALASDTTTKILSTPTVVTLDNKKALIHVGKNVPIVTGTYTNASGSQDPFQTIERRDVGIKLQVTPQINEGNTVRLEIRQEVSSVDPATDGSGLITNERTIETTVQVEDGEIIALGGLISDDVSEQRSAVPVLGDIPMVGNLFSSRRSTVERNNLVVFLRPTILLQDGRHTTLMEKRYRQMRELQLDGAGRGQGIALMPGERAATLPSYPPSPDQPIIDLPSAGAAGRQDAAAAAADGYREYPFFDIE